MQAATSLSQFVAAKIGAHCLVRIQRTTTRSRRLIAVANLQTTRIRERGLTRLVRVELTADLALSESLDRDMGAIVDMIQAQGMAAGQIYGYVPDPPWGPPHQCPGCQPRPDKPTHATKWNEWHACEKKLRVLGETSSCPIVRGERLPESYTNEERVARGGQITQRLTAPTQYESQRIAPLDIAPAVAVGTEPVSTQEPETKPRKVPAKRTQKPKEAPKGQGSLW
jgi:hypothetical protein